MDGDRTGMDAPPASAENSDRVMVPRRGFVRGAGAALGGAMLAGCPPASGQVEPPEPRDPEKPDDPRQECVRPEPLIPDEWYLPTRHLNALWSELYPRLAARVWRGATTPIQFADPTDWFADPGGLSPNEWLAHWALRFDAEDLGTPGFRNRMRQLAEYLRRPQAVPVQFVGGVTAWDFVLSEQGLDLFRPPTPIPALGPAQAAKDLYRYYTFRSTGRTPVAVPGVNTPPGALTGLDLATLGAGVNIPSPQGPSQIDMCGGSAQAVWITGGNEIPPRGRSPEEYRCEINRFWTLSGAVYRGILGELPRVIAHIHHASLQGAGATYADYAVRYIKPDNLGLRTIFRHRLETSIPDYGQPLLGDEGMLFEESRTDIPPEWEPERVIVTESGLLFPRLDAQRVMGWEALLTEIIAGRAGNPVFTDSSRST